MRRPHGLFRPAAAFALTCVMATSPLIASPCHAYDPLTWYTFDGGGVIGAVSGEYRLSGTIGQPDAGTLTGGSIVLRGGFWRGGTGVVGVAETAAPPLPFRFYLATPNPVRLQSRLAFDLPAATEARLRIYDVTGRVVQTMNLGPLPSGRHEITWSAVDDRGRSLPGGVYFMRLEAGASRGVQKVLVVR